MGTQAQQALQRRNGRPTRAGSTAADNAAGTRQAQARAVSQSGPKGTALRRKGPVKKKQAWDPGDGRMVGQAQYGGMGNGPMEVDPGSTRPLQGSGSAAMKRTRKKADPSQLVRDAIDAIARPSAQPAAAGGNIWDDPKYKTLAERHGADYALRARNLDEQINQARRMEQIREDALAHSNRMESMKLENRQLGAANRMYQEDSAQQSYVDPQTGLSVSGYEGAPGGTQPVYSGKGHQEAMFGKDPLSERAYEEKQKKSQRAYETKTAQDSQQHEVRKQLIESVSGTLNSLVDKERYEDGDREMISQLNEMLTKLTGGGQKKARRPSSEKELFDGFKERYPNVDEQTIRNSDAYKKALVKYGLTK